MKIRVAAAFLLLVLTAVAVGLDGCAQRSVEAGMVLSDMAAGSGDSALKRATPPPLRQTVRYIIEDRGREGDLYMPGQPELGAFVLVPGAARDGKDDPRLVAFANTLARARFVVLVPDIASLKELRVSASDSEQVEDAVRWLAKSYGGGAIGVAAISYAAGPAVLATRDLKRVDLLLTVGGYYDITSVVTFFTTGFVRQGAGWVHREPNAYGKWVFVESNAPRMVDSGDRVALAAIARRKMANLDAPVDDLVAHLTPRGRSVMDLLDNHDPERVPALVAALPPEVRDEMSALDLSRQDLSAVRAEAWIIHGRDDRIIPAEESTALAHALPHAHEVLLDHLAHADLGTEGWSDTLALWRAVAGMLKARDRLAGRGG